MVATFVVQADIREDGYWAWLIKSQEDGEARRWHLMARNHGATVIIMLAKVEKQPQGVNPQRLVKMVDRRSHPRR